MPQDYAEALNWFRKAAERGQANAQFSLGIMYKNGEDVPQDYMQAQMWVNLAASHERMSGAVEERENIASKMAPARIAEAQIMLPMGPLLGPAGLGFLRRFTGAGIGGCSSIGDPHSGTG